MESASEGIFAWVGEVYLKSNEWATANWWDFWYFTNEFEISGTISAFHAVICLFYTYWDSAILKKCILALDKFELWTTCLSDWSK